MSNKFEGFIRYKDTEENNTDNILCKAISRFGEDNQMLKAIEEYSEVIQAL